MIYSTFGVRTSLNAEAWKPKEGMKWEEKDFESDMKKLEKEATERLDKKIEELKSNIATVGK
jgi:cytochrome c556